eukprot:5087258-Pleurochrysis_carterae.AAC.1
MRSACPRKSILSFVRWSCLPASTGRHSSASARAVSQTSSRQVAHAPTPAHAPTRALTSGCVPLPAVSTPGRSSASGDRNPKPHASAACAKRVGPVRRDDAYARRRARACATTGI